MGIYEREYYREQQSVRLLRPPTRVVSALILVNVGLFLADGIAGGVFGGRPIAERLALSSDTWAHPAEWWQFLTYGFIHAPAYGHILSNMLGLWFLGCGVEEHYGRREFLTLYLLMVIVAGLAWAGVHHEPKGFPDSVYGASGAITGVVVLYALNFPRRTLLLSFIIPVPAWFVGVLLVVSDMLGATGGPGRDNVAYSAHLAGAAFAGVYFALGWRFDRLWRGGWRWPRLRRRPKLRLHDPAADEQELTEEADRILEKIARQGEASLSRRERRTLEAASRLYQRRRQERAEDAPAD
jgi:membrane associated rhomboid family serine protease